MNAALVNYRNSKVQKKAEELVKPTEDKLSLLLYNQVYIMQALGAIYRTGNYGSYLINNGIPIVSINGNDVVKPNQKLKDLARIKAMRNFTKLESEHVFVEDFLDDGKVTGGATTLGVTQDAFCVVGVNFDANYRNTDIMTDEVLAAGHKAADDLKSGKVVLPYVMEDDYKE